ncbi:Protein NRT1/ PTR FAMILY 1.2 [Linum perenne]
MLHLEQPSENLRFLNKACIIRNPEEELTQEGRAKSPWSLCTVDQVEDLKAVIRVIPIWSTGMIMAVTTCQQSFQLLQLITMDRHITPGFEIPAGSFSIFLIITLLIWVPFYDRVIIPLASKLKGRPIHLGLKQGLGLGILLSSVSMAALGLVENIRRRKAIEQGVSDNPNALVNMSAMWFLMYYVPFGVAEAFNYIGQNEFYYRELPKSMSSISTTLYQMGLSVSNLVASLILAIVDSVTKRGGNESWVAKNINKGHYDYYYWVLGCLCVGNFGYYVCCSKAYGPCKGEVKKALDQGEDI